MIKLTKRWIFPSLILLAYFYSIAPAPAYAYLDPGSQSFIVQLVVGGALGSLVFLRTMWANVISAITKPIANLFKGNKQDTGPE